MPTPQIVLIPCLSDNYAVLLHDADGGTTILVDAPEAGPIRAALERRGWRLDHILITHHHKDHVDGLAELKAATSARVTGPRAEADKIAGLDDLVAEGDVVAMGPFTARVLDTPGHTLGHVAYWFEGIRVLFSGDTLLSLGCGRVFEGTLPQMWESLGKLAALPDETMVFCGHEYTLSNARFALGLDPDNAALRERMAQAERSRADDQPTIPTTIGAEKRANPFLRAADPAIAAAVGLPGAPPAEVFAEVRRRKDRA